LVLRRHRRIISPWWGESTNISAPERAAPGTIVGIGITVKKRDPRGEKEEEMSRPGRGEQQPNLASAKNLPISPETRNKLPARGASSSGGEACCGGNAAPQMTSQGGTDEHLDSGRQ
jgi:hypothetical protein